MTPYKTTVIYGSVREQRQGIRGVKYILNHLEDRGHKVTFIDPVDYKLPLLDKMYKEYGKGEAPANMEKIAGILDASDGFIIVTGEYNHSIPPALKNLLDHFQQEFFFKPSGIACYSGGVFGGVRASLHLRIIMAELGSTSIPTVFPMPSVSKSFDENGNTQEKLFEKSIKKFLTEFEWYQKALKYGREDGLPQ